MSVEYLYSLGYQRIEPGLERIQTLLSDRPQDSFKSIHVAGTNGKGSVCAFLTSILMKSGYRVGTFTSPHLVDFHERIRINNEMIPDSELKRIVEKLKPRISNHSFFEAVTAVAFHYFKEQKVDWAVVEVGMGGRLDATNVLNPEVSVITNIGIDHARHLGKTIEEIAHEKSGIIKNTPVVTFQPHLIKKGDLRIADSYEGKLKMKGSFQHINAGIAKKTAEVIGIPGSEIKTGLSDAYWPGRFDYVADNLVLDCAHNVDGAKTLVNEVKDAVLVLGIMKDKDIKGMANEFKKAGRFIACKPKVERSADPAEIAQHLDCEIIPDLCRAIERARSYNKLVCVTGSIFTVGEAFECLGLKPFNTKVD